MGDLLHIGYTGLAAAKKNLQTTGHNIANVNTEGFSRQRVSQSTAHPVTKDGLIEGRGVKVTGINRIHDQFLQKRILNANSEKNFHSSLNDQLTQIEHVFNEMESDGMNFVINKFFNSFRELANQPENDVIRSVVRDNANLTIKDFHRINKLLDDLSHNIDLEIEKEVNEINSLMSTVAYLNKKIVDMESIDDEVSDFLDQRDLAVKKLSRSFKLKTYQDEKGAFVVSAHGVGTLVAGGHFQELSVRPTQQSPESNIRDGSVEVYFKSRPGNKITDQLKEGKIKALNEVRADHIGGLKEKLDHLAFNFANLVNAIHRRGYTTNKATDNKGNNRVVSSQSTGLDLFTIGSTQAGAASKIDLTDAIKKDPYNIATALEANRPADNRIALAIAKLQHERTLEGGSSTLEDYYLKSVGNVGVQVGKSAFNSRQAEALLTQSETLRERISGVSIDEEAANMVRFQQAFEASAKVMQSANDMFDTILSIKR